MNTNDHSHYLGVDVGKYELVTDLSAHQGPRSFANTEEGIAELAHTLKRFDPIPVVVCESSGGYERAMLEQLHRKGFRVCRVHARRVRSFALSEGIEAKTDNIDAEILTAFAKEKNPTLWQPPQRLREQIAELLQRRKQMVDLIRFEKNHRENAPPRMLDSIDESIASMQSRVDQFDKMIQELIDTDGQIHSFFERLCAVKGMGPVSASSLIAFVPELGKADDRRIASLIGLAPYNKDSGTRKGKRKRRGGRCKVRTPLYMAATAAIKSNPILAEFYHRLLKKGKPHKLAIIAVMRKLVILANKIAADPTFCPTS